MVRFVCASCGQKFKAAEEYVGQASQCPACGAMVYIPVAEPAIAGHGSLQKVLQSSPVLEKSEPAPEQNMPEYIPAPVIDPVAEPAAPVLKMRLRTGVGPKEISNIPPVSPSEVSESENKLSAGILLSNKNAPASGLKLPPAMKSASSAPKQALPVGFNTSTPKLPPGLRLVEEDLNS